MRIRITVLLLPALTLLLTGCNINRDISVPANAHWSSGSSTINGEINVGSNAVVDGSLRTINGRIHLDTGAQTGNLTSVNGSITLADGAHAGDLKTVNGGFTLGKNAFVGNLTAVNGDIRAADGVHISGEAENINGDMVLCGTRLDGNLSFYNGSVLIAAGSVINGNVTAKKPTHDYQDNAKMTAPVLIIAPHAKVDGSIIFERSGKLYVSDSATVHGIEGVGAIKFAGSAPPGMRLPACPSN
jgi:hypothetical protein